MQCMCVEENIHQRKYSELRKVLKRWKTRNVKLVEESDEHNQDMAILRTSSASSISSGPSIMYFAS